MPNYANIVVVAKSGGDYDDPIAAITSISDASAAKPYLVKIMPGVYDLGTGSLQMKDHVNVDGSGSEATILTGSSNATVTIHEGNCTLSNLKILNAHVGDGGNICIYLGGSHGNVVLKNLAIENNTPNFMYGFSGISGTAGSDGPLRLENITVNSTVTFSTFHHRGIDIGMSEGGPVVTMKDIRVVMSGGDMEFGIVTTWGRFEINDSYIEVRNGNGSVPLATLAASVKLADTVLIAKDGASVTRSLQVDGRNQPVAAVVEARNCEFHSSSNSGVVDTISNASGGSTFVAHSLVGGSFDSGAKLVNCFDQNYDPIP
jgi:hypothetical protein